MLTALALASLTAPDPAHEVDNHHVDAHHVAAFLGATTRYAEEESSTHLTIGADYVFYLPVMERRIGLGALVDATFGHELELVVAPLFALKAVSDVQLAFAPGLAFEGGHKQFVGRLNLSYVVHLGSVSAGPSVSVDFFPHHTSLIYGLSVGTGL